MRLRAIFPQQICILSPLWNNSDPRGEICERSVSLDINHYRDSAHIVIHNRITPFDLHQHQNSAFVWFDFVSSLLSRKSETARISPALKTMSIRLLIDGQYRGNSSSFILFFRCHDISMNILPRIAFELEGFLSSVRCMLGENDCVNHQTCGGRCRLMLQRGARAGAQLQQLDRLLMNIWSKIMRLKLHDQKTL